MNKNGADPIQRIELSTRHAPPLHCPFCGERVVGWDADDSSATMPCRHTLFVAHDMGFEFRSSRFDEAMGLGGIEADDVDLPEAGFDGLTDHVRIDGAVKFAWYEGPPGQMGSYVGFAPLEED